MGVFEEFVNIAVHNCDNHVSRPTVASLELASGRPQSEGSGKAATFCRVRHVDLGIAQCCAQSLLDSSGRHPIVPIQDVATTSSQSKPHIPAILL